MNAIYTDKHTENAIDLCGLRLNWLNATDIHANAFESVEERLRANLKHSAHALHSIAAESPQPENKKTYKKEAECFVFLASHITSNNPAIGNSGYDLAYQWLTEDAAKAAAAETALSLYPAEDNVPLHKLYAEQEAQRPSLFRIFRKQMASLPLAFVNTAATAEGSTAALKIEALNYAAANKDIGLDIFRTHYVPLLSGKTQFDANIIEAAIWGGMLRGDPDTTRAITNAIINTGAATERARLLRLAALTGAAEFLTLLLQSAETDPTTGYYLLTLYGQKSVIPELLKALEIAHSMEAAATTFTQLTDQLLTRVPRMTVVGEEETDDEPEQIPDIKAARAWWDKNQAKWKEGERWITGKPATPKHLLAMTKKYAGQYGRDVMAMLALAHKAPVNIPSEIWRVRQQQLLDEQFAAKPEAQPAAQPAAKPESRLKGLFSKKPAAAPVAKAAPAPQATAITGLGIACHAGDQPYALITSVLGQMSGTRLSKEFPVLSSDGSSAVPRMAPIKQLGDDQAQQRMFILSSSALRKAAAHLPANVKAESLLIVTMVDPMLVSFNSSSDQHLLQGNMVDGVRRLETSTFRFFPNDTSSSSSALRTALAELNEGKWQAVIFGGADSLISKEACRKLSNDNRLNIIGKTEGIIPGEAAAFVVLQSAESAANNTTPALGYLRGIGVAAEPNARDSDIEPTEGLTTAINQALTQAGMAATDIQGIVHNLGAETVQALEWYQTSVTLWPRKISEQQRMAVQLGEIDQPEIPDDPIPRIELPYMTMGDVGAAAMPIQLATALAWIEYDAQQTRFGFPAHNHLLVCDTPDAAERGALIVSTQQAAA